jgi:hypothetical protein
MGPGCGGTGAGVFRRRLSFFLGKIATVFQAEVFAIMAWVHDIKVHGLLEKLVSICSESLVALKAFGPSEQRFHWFDNIRRR